jgi:hypothetical protein
MKQKLLFLTALFATLSALSAEYFVDASRPDDSGAATNWATAKQTIQAAVDLSVNGDTVWVTNGVYDTGGARFPGSFETNRVCMTNAITVQSVNGPESTIIDGGGLCRGVFMANGGILTGFAVTNGNSSAGGGVWLSENGVVSNCVIIKNVANSEGGGGVYLDGGGVVDGCTIERNISYSWGGGACLHEGGQINNCIITLNSASSDSVGWGGGVILTGGGGILNQCVIYKNDATHCGAGVDCYEGGTLNNCTIVANAGMLYEGSIVGGGVAAEANSTLNNCILWGNSKNDIGFLEGIGALRHCCAGWVVNFGHYLNIHGVNGCITNDPLFADESNMKLKVGSPCINAGNNIYAPTNVTPYDLEGNPRIMDEIVDMGAYEGGRIGILTTASRGGTISPLNPVVIPGEDVTLLIQPDENYSLDELIVDDISIPLSETYTFTNVQTQHTISAKFITTNLTLYVDSSRPDDSGNGTSWGEAFKTIQGAVDFALDGSVIWVTNGVYDKGQTVVELPMSQGIFRVKIEKPVTVRSVNGPEVTIIKGAPGSNGGVDTNSVGGVFLDHGATLIGFTIRDGYLGAVWWIAAGLNIGVGCMASDCIITRNTWPGSGAAVIGVLNNSILINNGVMVFGTLNNCTLVGTFELFVLDGLINNSIVWVNSAGEGCDKAFRYCCVSTGVTHGVNGCITNDPLFVNAANGDFRLQSNSPCINWGNNVFITNAADLAGNPRIVEGTVDMGAYEYQGIVGLADSDNDGISDDWERQYGGNQNPDRVCSNGVNTILQAYIAGLNPNDPDSKFLTSVFRSSTSSILGWNTTSGRVYSVYFSTNLLNGFQCLETNIPWIAGCYTDLVHSACGEGFYKIGVEMDD